MEPAENEQKVATTDALAASTERAIGGLVVAALAIAVLSGIVLTFVYRPGEHAWLRTVHAGSSAVAGWGVLL